MSNLDAGPAEFVEVPSPSSEFSYHDLVRLALTTIPAPGSRPSRYASLLVMRSAVELCYRDIAEMGPSSMDPEDTRILRLTGRNLASYASSLDPDTVADGTLGAALSGTWDLLDRLFKKLNFSASRSMDQHSHGLPSTAASDAFSKGSVPSLMAEAGSAAHPFFGRLRRDNYDTVTKKLMGDPRPDPILIPSVLTDDQLPEVAKNYQEASSYLLRVCNSCSLLLQQCQLVKNASAFVASAAQHCLTRVLPMPSLDPGRCFWRKKEMRRETQVNILFLLRRICRIYSAATACVQQSRGLVAIRSTALACAACVADAICRVTCIDDPSPFSLHYSGACEGPTEPFGIEAGSFESLGSNLPISDPQYTALRFQCLDYLRGLSVKDDGSACQTVFNFDVSLTPSGGDLDLIDQLSIQLALPRPYPQTEKARVSHTASLIGGTNGAIIEVLSEFECFRDIVFHFKHSVSGKSQTPSNTTDNYIWKASDSTLHWTTQPRTNDDPTPVYHVTAFRGHHQEFVDVVSAGTKSKGTFASFLNFFGKSSAERAKLSAADPTNVVNSCADKFQKSK